MQVRRKVFSYAVDAYGDVRLFSTANVAGSGLYQKNFGFGDTIGKWTGSLAKALGYREKDLDITNDSIEAGKLAQAELDRLRETDKFHREGLARIRDLRENNPYARESQVLSYISRAQDKNNVWSDKERELGLSKLGKYVKSDGTIDINKLKKNREDLITLAPTLTGKSLDMGEKAQRQVNLIKNQIKEAEGLFKAGKMTESQFKDHVAQKNALMEKAINSSGNGFDAARDEVLKALDANRLMEARQGNLDYIREVDAKEKELRKEYKRLTGRELGDTGSFDLEQLERDVESGKLSKSFLDKIIEGKRKERGARTIKIGAPIAGGVLGGVGGYGIGSFATRNMDPKTEASKIKAIKVGSTIGGATLGAVGGHYGAKYGLKKANL